MVWYNFKVWSEEDNFDMLNQMIDSFEQKYAGQAKFEITLEQNADSDTKDILLGDIHNGRMFSRLRMISFLQWLPLVHYIRCQMQKK